MNGFVKKSVGTLTLGERLRKIRTDRRISLGEVSRSTKIQVRYLEALEAGDWDNLPADVYVRGFLRSYADFFGTDDRIFLKLYDKEKGIKRNIEVKNGKNKKEREPFKPLSISFISMTPKKAWITFISIFALVVIVFVYNELGSFADTPKLVVLSPEDNSEVLGNSVTVSGVTEKDSRLFINGQPVLVGDDGNFRQEVNLQSGTNVIAVKAINRFNKEVEYSLDINSRVENNLPERDEAVQEEKELVIEIRVDPGPVWLNVETDGQLAFDGNMLSGPSQTFKASDKIVVSSGKGDATFIRVDGKEENKLSEDPGPVKESVFTNGEGGNK